MADSYAADPAPPSPLAVQAIDPQFDRLVSADAKVHRLATGMIFTEGPIWIDDPAGGYLVFSDIPANELKRWSETDGLSTFRKPSHNANGNALDAAGNLLTCEHGSRVVSITEKGERRVLLDRFEGRRFNSPNDVVVKSDGTIWFTDPPYGLPRNEWETLKELPGHFVFRFDPKTSQLAVVARDLDMPNGLCFSPDERHLYIADSGAPRNIRVYPVNADGATLGEGREFAKIDVGGPDGIRCDIRGNLWSTSGDGVQVFTPAGNRVGRVLLPEGGANLCFGGPSGTTLFITARKSLYSVETNVRAAAATTR